MNSECIYVLPRNKQEILNYLLLAEKIKNKITGLEPIAISVITRDVKAYDRYADFEIETKNTNCTLQQGTMVLFVRGEIEYMNNFNKATVLWPEKTVRFTDIYEFSGDTITPVEDYKTIKIPNEIQTILKNRKANIR